MSSSGSAEPTVTWPSGARAGPGAAADPGAATPRLVPQRRQRPIFLLVGAAAAVGGAAVLVVLSGNRGSPARLQAGSPVPAFALPRLGAAGTVSVPGTGGGNGRPAVLLFFASWCTPCQHEIPSLAAAYRRQQSSGSRLAKVALIGVDGNDPTGSALRFVHGSGVTFPVGVDPTYAVTSGKFDFSYLPESVMVSGNGTIEAVHYGALSSADLVRWEQKLLAASS